MGRRPILVVLPNSSWFDCSGLFTMTIDLIFRSVFSIKVGMGSNNENQFVNLLKTFLTGHAQPSALLPWARK